MRPLESGITILDDPIILVDQDNTIADFEGGFLFEWRSRYPNRPFIPLDERTTFRILDQYPVEYQIDVKDIYSQPGFVRNLKPILGAVDALRIMEACGMTVRVVTSPLSNSHCEGEKLEWIEQHLGSSWAQAAILTKDKTTVAGTLMIDDKPEIIGVQNPTWEHIIFDQPFNRYVQSKRRLLSWNDWRTLL